MLINGKGVHIRDMHQDIPFLFDKDMELIRIANKFHLEYVGLSFVRSAENVREAKALLADGIKVISKIETKRCGK